MSRMKIPFITLNEEFDQNGNLTMKGRFGRAFLVGRIVHENEDGTCRWAFSIAEADEQAARRKEGYRLRKEVDAVLG